MQRPVVFFLLLFCCVDLGLAENCAEDPVPDGNPAAFSHASDEADPADYEHECFCCCRHIVHESFFQVADATLLDTGTELLRVVPPESSRPTVYHPPRA